MYKITKRTNYAESHFYGEPVEAKVPGLRMPASEH